MSSDEERRSVCTAHPSRDESLDRLGGRIGSTHFTGQVGGEGVAGIGGDLYDRAFPDSVQCVAFCIGLFVVVTTAVDVGIITSRRSMSARCTTECYTATFPSSKSVLL